MNATLEDEHGKLSPEEQVAFVARIADPFPVLLVISGRGATLHCD
jgi:hypothetical protein